MADPAGVDCRNTLHSVLGAEVMKKQLATTEFLDDANPRVHTYTHFSSHVSPNAIVGSVQKLELGLKLGCYCLRKFLF
jgi:hypothetical protein